MIFSRFRNVTARSELTMKCLIQLGRENGDAYFPRYLGSSSRTQVSTLPARRTAVRTTFRSAFCSNSTNTTQCTKRENHRFVSFMNPKTGLSANDYQPNASEVGEMDYVMDDDGQDQTDSVPTADKDSTKTEMPYSDRSEEQILVINRSNNRSRSPRFQTRYFPHAKFCGLMALISKTSLDGVPKTSSFVILAMPRTYCNGIYLSNA